MARLETASPIEPAPPIETGQGLWPLIKSIVAQIPTTVMDPMPMGYVANAPSFISRFLKDPKAPALLIPEEIKSGFDLIKAGLRPQGKPMLSSLIDKWGKVWDAPMSHESTMMKLISGKDPAYMKPLVQEYLANKMYFGVPNGLTDYQMIRKTGRDLMMDATAAEIPLNATPASLESLIATIPRRSKVFVDYRVPIHGASSTDVYPFKRFMGVTDSGKSFTQRWDKFEPNDLLRTIKELNQMALESYPKFLQAGGK